MQKLRLGINIDHVATIRNARGGVHPDPLRAALLAEKAGADGITAHLREDRRHISDHDIAELKKHLSKPLNFEMAATDEMLEIALATEPHACCIVPEKRSEVTTEGGLNVVANQPYLNNYIATLKEKSIRVSLFVEADKAQIDAAKKVGAQVVELHTGTYTHRTGEARAHELKRIEEAASYASLLGLEVHAGHGLSYDTVAPIAAITQIVELNIGHFLVGEAIFIGFEAAIKQMRQAMDKARGT